MNYENWISYRYLTASKGRFLSFLNFISVAGIAIGVASLIVVIGVMSGFANNLREKIIGTTPHLMIQKETGIPDYDVLDKQIRSLKGVEGVSPYIQGNIFLESSGQAVGIGIRGIRPETESEVTNVGQYLVKGKLADLKGRSIIIGSELARFYGYDIGDTLTLITPGSGVAGKGWRHELTIKGIFKSGMADYDLGLVVVSLATAQTIFNLDSNVATGIGVRLKDPNAADEIKTDLYKLIGFSYLVRSWIDINRNLFEALFLEKWGLFIILTLMVIVASFNIISTLIVTVTSKVHDIGILQSIGVPKSSIRRIFTKQGLFIGIHGIFWGLVFGCGISYILRHYVEVPAEIYSIDRVPVELQLTDILAIVAAALIISFLATIYPSAKAANLQPVEALRYE